MISDDVCGHCYKEGGQPKMYIYIYTLDEWIDDPNMTVI